MKNSSHFVEMMRNICIEEGEILVTFDVASLFTNVPTDEAVHVICGRLFDDKTLDERTSFSPDRVAELLERCLRTTYFS